ncbi:MAG: penicillin-binding protein 1C [Pseudomonadota bacterium]
MTLALGLIALSTGQRAVDAWVDATELPPLSVRTGAEVTASDGTLLRAFPVETGLWRLAIDGPDAVDPRYVRMLVAYEDKRFWEHSGVDARAMIRAAGQSVWNGRVVSGGSTLTMQVARLLEGTGTGSLAGKLRQVRLALALEREVSKDEILDLYLHLVPMGGNLEGVRAGCFAWLGKPPRRLTEAEAALLIAIPQAPEARRPDRNAEAARRARDRVLRRVLPEADAKVAMTEPAPQTRRPFPARAPHLAARLAPAGGHVRTTIDATLQRRVEEIAAGVERGRGLSAAIILADHGTGAMLANVGAARPGEDEGDGWVDMTRAVRSPGSTLKPLVYALAFDAGIAHPESLISDRPTDFGGYRPQNFDGGFRGDLRVREALALSLNVPAVALTEAVGPAPLLAAMRRAGMRPVIPGAEPGLALALGGGGVTLEDLVTLYGTLARGGRAMPPLSVSPGVGGERPVVGSGAAWQVGDILAGLPPPPGAPALGIAYKTGTSYGYRDAWALGWDGRHVAGVWIGRPDGTPVPGALGGDVAAPILFEVFAQLGTPAPLPPPQPDVLMVSSADLPPPLRRAGRAVAKSGPRLAFPPDGAEVEIETGLWLKVADGRPPFTWLVDGRPVILADRSRETVIDLADKGRVSLSVIDAEGRAARASVTLR